jgi:predicted hydrolase (HD superfamily)
LTHYQEDGKEMSSIPARDEALSLLKEYNKEEWHIRHALAVEAVMRHFSCLLDAENEDKWGIVGLLHDIDFEMYPGQHCVKAREILRGRGVGEDIVYAVASHGWGLPGVDAKPEQPMEKALFTIDELTGLIAAVAVIRPSKSVLDLEVGSVMKKFKTPGFAAGVSRKTIEEGAALMGLELDYIIGQTLMGMRGVAVEIGLKGLL